MDRISEGWAVELTGNKLDLDDFREQLKPPFNPWIENYETDDGIKPLLRCTDWQSLTEAADVHRDAARMVDWLNGEAKLIHDDAMPVGLGMTMRFGADGKREPIILATTGHIRIKMGRARGRIAMDTDAPPQESKMQRWLREAEADDVRADLFAHLRRADNWYDLYKVMELAERLVGSQHELEAHPDVDGKEWRRVRRTANHYRHARHPVNHQLPDIPATLEEGIAFVCKTVPHIL
jgi:hypothetical protein